MDHFVFWDDTLTALGYKGVYTQRSGTKVDGCAVFYRPERFEVSSLCEVELNEVHKKTKNPDHLRNNVALYGTFMDKISKQMLIVVCVHLFWNPNYSGIQKIHLPNQI